MKEKIYEQMRITKNQIKDLWELLTYNKFIFSILITVAGAAFFVFMINPPQQFTPGTIINIEEGTSIKQTGYILESENIIRSASVFNLIVQLSKNSVIMSGEYLFSEGENVFTVARRLITGDYGIPTKRITITEGMTVFEIADKMASNFPKFNSDKFSNLAMIHEGYLFPDTYIFSLFINETQVIQAMRDNFNNRIKPFLDDIEESDKTLHEIVIMASIVEKEATRATIQEVSDVLWHRLGIGMLLQVDATFVYSIGKNSFTVTLLEMRDETDPYNTYVHPGLPPTPISNPGLDAIKASIYNNPTEYLYFLTGRDGEMYFATSFEDHIINRRRFID